MAGLTRPPVAVGMVRGVVVTVRTARKTKKLHFLETEGLAIRGHKGLAVVPDMGGAGFAAAFAAGAAVGAGASGDGGSTKGGTGTWSCRDGCRYGGTGGRIQCQLGRQSVDLSLEIILTGGDLGLQIVMVRIKDGQGTTVGGSVVEMSNSREV